MSTALVHSPESLPASQVAAFCEDVARFRAQCEDASHADDLRRQIEAVRRYVLDREAREALEREARRTEVLIGELLGPAVIGKPRGGLGSNLELNKVDRNRFRKLADHAELVERMLEQGVYRRKAILDANAAAGESPRQSPDHKHSSYGAVVIDPPWQYGNAATKGAAGNHYSTMTLDELAALPDICEPFRACTNAHLYLWTTTGFLRESFDLLDAWGFTYKTNLVWVKPQIGLGNYFRTSHEHVLFAVKGGAGRTMSRDIPSWFKAKRERHSKKPDAFFDLVEASSPGPYLDVFARPRQGRFGAGEWDYWGNES